MLYSQAVALIEDEYQCHELSLADKYARGTSILRWIVVFKRCNDTTNVTEQRRLVILGAYVIAAMEWHARESKVPFDRHQYYKDVALLLKRRPIGDFRTPVVRIDKLLGIMNLDNNLFNFGIVLQKMFRIIMTTFHGPLPANIVPREGEVYTVTPNGTNLSLDVAYVDDKFEMVTMFDTLEDACDAIAAIADLTSSQRQLGTQ